MAILDERREKEKLYLGKIDWKMVAKTVVDSQGDRGVYTIDKEIKGCGRLERKEGRFDGTAR